MKYKIEFLKVGRKTTIALLTTESGFEIIGKSSCVNPADYNFEIGKNWATKDAISKLEDYKAFIKQIDLIKETLPHRKVTIFTNTEGKNKIDRDLESLNKKWNSHWDALRESTDKLTVNTDIYDEEDSRLNGILRNDFPEGLINVNQNSEDDDEE